MKYFKIPDKNNSHYHIFEASDVEFCDPIKYYANIFIKTNTVLSSEFISHKLPIPSDVINNYSRKHAILEWDNMLNKFLQTDVPKNFFLILQSQTKNEQINLLKGQCLHSNQKIPFIFKSFRDYHFLFSQYKFEHLSNDIDSLELPTVIDITNKTICKIGDSSLSDGQLKHAINYRHIVVSKFLDNGNNWHCFFLTFKSLKGNEGWKNGQPHFHYISDKFGISRENVLKEFKSKNYRLGSLPHIDLIR